MEKLPMCRICLVENVHMYAVVSKYMQDVYQSLTDVPFVTEDTRPALACYFCYAKLKQCCRLQLQCREAEELFAQMMNEPNPAINRGQLELFNGFVKTQVVDINIDGVGQMEYVTIKEELPVYYEGPEEVVEPEEESLSDDIKFENTDNGYSDVEDTPLTPPQHFEADVHSMEIKIEVEEMPEVLEATDTSTTAAEKTKEETHRTKLEDVILDEEMNNTKSDTQNNQTTQNRSPKIKLKEPHKCDSLRCVKIWQIRLSRTACKLRACISFSYETPAPTVYLCTRVVLEVRA
ncbi:hypothetical protein PYW08_012335 [Mythimna loreyi]|uniref:Uncharacterized protein n=1 Tax=Mythimna loreyi TaxID=667449 RepID=A0ACC2Q2A9_9NEOP|nr:hypothetical protein PYW08_012335 [Mythimna loreyi]